VFNIGWRTGSNSLPSAVRLQQEDSSWLWCSCWECWGGSTGTLHHQSQGMITSVEIRIPGLCSSGTHESFAS